jgi:four helix bundle protein
MGDFRELKVWQKAHELTLDVYRVTAQFPKQEIYGLVSQMRRCAASVGSNIAEGKGRRGDIEFGRFIQIACGSLTELEYQLLLSRDLKYLPETDYRNMNQKLAEVNRMLVSLQQKVKAAKAGTLNS